jgi:translation elongation factor P/translation initiation factor 5A
MNTAYDKWVASRRFSDFLNEEVEVFDGMEGRIRGFMYDADGSFIQFMDDGRFWTISTNEDILVNTLEEAQKWLWNNWSRHNVEEEVTIDPQLG